MSSSTLFISLFKYKSWANEQLFALVKNVDVTAYADQLHASIRVLNHIHVVDKIFQANLQGLKHTFEATNTPETPSLENLLAAVREVDGWYVNYVSTLKPEELETAISFAFTDQKQGRMSREEMLSHVITHGAYHRGAVGKVLAQIGVAPPKDVITKFLHECEPERRA